MEMEILFTMIFGLCLRFVLGSSPVMVQGKLYPAILGVWEGACLRYLINGIPPSSSSSLDPILSYAVRLCIDYFITDSFGQVIAMVVWSFLGVLVVESVEVESIDERRSKRPKGTGSSFTRIQEQVVDQSTTEEDTLPLPVSPAQNVQESSPLPLSLPLSSSSSIQREEYQPEYPEDDVNDDLQTPLPQSRVLIPEDDDDNDDELQTPLALLPISSLPELSIPADQSILLRPIRSTSTSPVPIPAPALPYITTSSPHPASPSSSSLHLSTLHPHSHSLSPSSSSQQSTILLSPTSLYTHADALRKQAWKEHHFLKTQLEKDLVRARSQGNTTEAFMLLGEIKDTLARIDKLHGRAKRRFYLARNNNNNNDSNNALIPTTTTSNPSSIDVHGLLVPEAIDKTEEAFRGVLRTGNRFLRVIVGKGNHSKNGMPKLRPAIIHAFNRHGFKCTVDVNNSGIVILEAPSPPLVPPHP
ncbi:uncharacterized protein C8R40DRAFT_1118551 [Lentinula edodes]|uniref:uncharacterized protein n=1 Tax=Lentinula edodes TaxID=5353 RepID=UPI001E8DC475|nr:uncharacterized protein C8R40DRAFT_1118551 [Lentinula edodes]KAH7872144.1 hypothetical protein C8R40DRAFT_1118551 [Lentinula edodes]